MPDAVTDLNLRSLVPVIGRAPGFREVLQALAGGQSAALDGAWGSCCALATAGLVQGVFEQTKGGCPLWLVVLPRISEVDDFAVDFSEFFSGGSNPESLLIFPAWESLPQEASLTDPVFTARLRILREIGAPKNNGPGVVITSFPALLQPVPHRDELSRATRTLRVGDETDPEELLRWLVDRGFERVAGIEFPGEFSVHGGIVDLFPPTDSVPLRIEFFGDEIESIRQFDPESQRKIADLPEAVLTVLSPAVLGRKSDGWNSPHAQPEKGKKKASRAAVSENPNPAEPPQAAPSALEHFADALPTGTRIALVELSDMLDEGRHFLSRLDNPKEFFGVDETVAKCIRHPSVTVAALAADSFETTCHLQVQSIERFNVAAAQVKEELGKIVGKEEQVLLACHNEGERQRLTEFVTETELYQQGRLHLCEGRLLHGFRLVSERLIVLSDHELFGRQDIRRTAPQKKLAKIESRAIDSFLELSPGDYVVHLTKGIAKYGGLELLSVKGQQIEHLALEFRNKTMVYVPVSSIDLVQKYVGVGNIAPVLSALGSSSWERKKQDVMEAVTDLASEMIQLQAERAGKPGHAFPEDTHWQQEFEAAFPYTPTVDQSSAIADVKADMQKGRPMDRLLCGDVGYGKTEVSLRGVFKAIEAGKQVAVLVPTTVLAEQHYRTFCGRLAEYPFTVEVLSRFRTKAQQRRTLEGLAAGSVDVVIGTHRLVQPDVNFKDLGMLVIDEEQRFGVDAKEKLKKLRLEVDVLTMSATPIPRTLHMSLIGIRDISNLQTPPHDRIAIETRISRFDKELIRHGIVRELNRGGQVFFVHNRVYNIEEVADTVHAIVPEAKIGIVHGQMPENEMEDAMVAFVNGRTDVLVATTIIESGLDIPSANTIFIHQADKYGLADLHQLRGRVGRYKHRAYCYLLLEEGQTLTSTAAKRLKAIEEFSELGAGFKIAMRDLEIRGAGNILGNEQSGHIASVGYELYCQLLENAVRTLQSLPVKVFDPVRIDLPLSGFLPNTYVPPGRHKLDVYRKLSRVETLYQLEELAAELRDRFGPIPPMALMLLELKALEVLARHWDVTEIFVEERFLVYKYRNPNKIRALARIYPQLRIVDSRSAYLKLDNSLDLAGESAGTELLEISKSLLQPI